MVSPFPKYRGEGDWLDWKVIVGKVDADCNYHAGRADTVFIDDKGTLGDEV